MHPGIVAALASETAEHGTTFLGEDIVGWRIALIAALPAAVLYEMTMALTRKMTLRLPFLILKLARLGMSKAEWERQGSEWVAELWSVLGDRDRHWFLRFVDGMSFAIPLAVGGARRAATVSVKAGLRLKALRVPKRGRHAAAGPSVLTIAKRIVEACVVVYVMSAAGAHLTQTSVVAWAVWVVAIAAVLFALLIAVIFILDTVEDFRRYRLYRRIDRLHREVELGTMLLFHVQPVYSNTAAGEREA
ncbi:hypothetical protein ABT301_35810 [Streptomyces sp. NPDC000987]|uniref:hypothetical protein n=1 Tax=Streptomyces sp. NPDC000987 TaxID=3154374 RepID=UPI00331D90EA